MVKNLPANAGDVRDVGSIPGTGRSPGEGDGNPFQYSCLGNSMDREAWQTTIHGVTNSQMQLSTHRPAHTHTHSLPKNIYFIFSQGVRGFESLGSNSRNISMPVQIPENPNLALF